MVLVSLCAVGADTRRSFDLIIAERFAMKKIVISEFMDESAVFKLSRNNTVVYDKNLFQNRGELLHVCKDADAVIVRNKTQVDQELLSAAVKMKAVGRLGVGLDNIDTEYYHGKGSEQHFRCRICFDGYFLFFKTILSDNAGKKRGMAAGTDDRFRSGGKNFGACRLWRYSQNRCEKSKLPGYGYCFL